MCVSHNHNLQLKHSPMWRGLLTGHALLLQQQPTPSHSSSRDGGSTQHAFDIHRRPSPSPTHTHHYHHYNPSFNSPPPPTGAQPVLQCCHSHCPGTGSLPACSGAQQLWCPHHRPGSHLRPRLTTTKEGRSQGVCCGNNTQWDLPAGD